MELRHLQYFVAVAEELHFGRAARRMNISQPPLSQQIRALEEELGVRLFFRTSRTVSLTEAGRYFLDEAKGILERAAYAGQRAKDIGAGVAGRLAVGFVGPAIDGPLPAAIREFQDTYPGVVLELLEQGTEAQIKGLQAGRIQLGFVRWLGRDLPGFRAVPFVREAYCLALPRNHPLVARRKIPLECLEDQPIIFYPRKTQPALYDRMTACFRKAGFEPRYTQEVQTKHATIALVAAGLGVALVPVSSTDARRLDVVYRPLVGELPPVEIAVIRPEGAALPLLDNFLEIILKYRKLDELVEPGEPGLNP